MESNFAAHGILSGWPFFKVPSRREYFMRKTMIFMRKFNFLKSAKEFNHIIYEASISSYMKLRIPNSVDDFICVVYSGIHSV